MKEMMIKLGLLCMLCCIIYEVKPKDKEVINDIEEDTYVIVSTDDDTNEIELETYLLGVVASEMPYSFEMEALKAQAVAARTFVCERNLLVDNTTSNQVYKSEQELIELFDEDYEEMKQIIEEAINATKGEVLTYDDELISALFYSSNNGYTNNSQDYYANSLPYLVSVESSWDIAFDSTIQTINMSIEDVISKLGVYNLDISNIVLYDNGYVNTIQIGDTIFSGREVRELLGLRSSCFSIVVIDEVYIETKGYGHGVGMSQYGAQGMALEGYTYEEILTYYYTGVEITQLNE